MAKASWWKDRAPQFCDAKKSWHLQVVGKKLGFVSIFSFFGFTGLGAHITATLIFHALKFLPEDPSWILVAPSLIIQTPQSDVHQFTLH